MHKQDISKLLKALVDPEGKGDISQEQKEIIKQIEDNLSNNLNNNEEKYIPVYSPNSVNYYKKDQYDE